MSFELPRLALFSVVLTGCTGSIAEPTAIGEAPRVAPGVAPSGQPNAGSSAGPNAGSAAAVDPGRVGIHRLNNTEYDNTVRDLFGTASRPAATFLAEEGNHFDNTATALGMTTPQYEGYFKAASDLLDEAMANPAERARFMSCTPEADGDPCARQIIASFGMKIYRRPLEAEEIDRAMAVYDDDFARAGDAGEAVALALRAMLSAANFLYRVEYDADPTSTQPHPLSGYELASRLSYLHWSSMPDEALFDAAASGELLEPAALEATVDRMLADAKAGAFVESFAGQWLSLRKLLTHTVTDQVFPTYTPALSDAMIAEGNLWFQEFLSQDRAITDWFTADFNYVNDLLAEHYRMPSPGSGDQPVRVEVTTDQRRGFLGLASFLTLTSVPSRTSPTTRGAWVLTHLLCSPPAPPPGNVPALDNSADPDKPAEPTGAENVRDRLERHRVDPVCSGCHAQLDPIGLGLERYDGIGRYRETYGNGDAIAPQGELPDGTPFAGPEELGALLAEDPRFTACVGSNLFTYALGREIDNAIDAPTLMTLKARWEARGLTLRSLLKEVVLSSAFRFRRGEPE